MNHLFYKEKGTGYPVIFIHGFCETHEIWEGLTDRLSTIFRTISVDLPGFGKSNSLPSPNSIETAAENVVNLIRKELQLDACVILGHSMGGYVALAMAEKDPALFNGMGLIHSTAYADSDERKVSRNKVIEFVNRHGVGPFIQSFIPPLFNNQLNPYIPATVALASKTSLSTLISYTEAMRDRPERIHVIEAFQKPVLFIAGKSDIVIPLKAVQEQALVTQKHTLRIMERVGHMGMLEAVDETARVITDFLAEIT